MSKVDSIKAAMPKRYAVTKPNGLLNALLSALGLQDDGIDSQILNAKQMVFVATALGKYLDRLGNNYNVSRPSVNVSDDIFRELIRDIAWKKHNIINIIRAVLEDFFGPSDGSNWDVFQIRPGEIIIQVHPTFAPRTLEDATYFHDGDEGTSTAVGVNFLTDSTKTWTVNQWTGFRLYDSASTEFEITSNTASTLTVVGNPVAGHYVILHRSSESYEGDYFVNDESVLGSTVGENTVIVAESVVFEDVQTVIELVVKAAGVLVVFET